MKLENLQDIESKLTVVQKGEKHIHILQNDITEYANTCKSIKQLIEAQKPSIVLCTMPESYLTARIVKKIGASPDFKMIPSFSSKQGKVYPLIAEIVENASDNGLSVAIIDCWHDNASKYFQNFMTALDEILPSKAKKGYYFELTVAGVGEESSGFEHEPKAIIPDDFDQNIKLSSKICSQIFKAPGIIKSHEIAGAQYADRELKKTVYRGKIIMHGKLENEVRTSSIHDSFVDLVLRSS